MKIHPGQRSPGMSQAVSKSKSDARSASFADVLAQASQTPRTEQPAAASPAAPILRPATAAPGELYQTTQRALDAMERYQHLLADGGVNLRTVEPAVRALEHEIAGLGPLMEATPEDHPVLQVARQTLVTAAKEIARFDRGDYIGD
jgi:hypothetical protein